MKKLTHPLINTLLCIAAVLIMCAAFTTMSHATTGVSDGSVLSPSNVNTASSTPDYQISVSDKSATVNYSLKVPGAGTVFITYPYNASTIYVSGGGVLNRGQFTQGDNNVRVYSFPAAGTANISMDIFASEGYTTTVQFSVRYASKSQKITATKDYKNIIVGSPDSSNNSTVSITVPGKGYLEFAASDPLSSYSSIKYKTKGFKDFEYLSSSNSNTTYVGVKKGTYKFSIKNSAAYSVVTKFHSVKETSLKTSQSKAASIKKGKLNKGLIVTDNKKVHWYKIKNPKNQKVNLVVNGKKMSKGNSGTSYLKITVIFPDKKKSTAKLYPGTSDTFKITYGKIGTSKARKGTYKIKVESVGGTNGYYTLKWK